MTSIASSSRPASLTPAAAAHASSATALRAVLAAGTTVGFGVMVAMWVSWFLMHMPVSVAMFPPAVAGPMLLGVLLVGTIWGVRAVPTAHRLGVGLLAGLVCGGVNLLIIGSKLTTPTDDALRGTAAAAEAMTAGATVKSMLPSAPLMVAGWIGACVIVGLVAAFIGRLVWRDVAVAAPVRWLGRMAIVATVAVLPLLTLGGLVTTAKAGFAVPDWPGTFGSNMFLYPIALMSEPRVFLEHTHRLFGTMVGLTTIALTVFAIACAPRRWMKFAAAALLALVIIQGILGGVWVENKSTWLVLTHGSLGQIFFGLMAAFAAVLSLRWWTWHTDDAANARLGPALPTVLTIALVITLTVQLIFGTMIRHLNSSHALWSHVIFSIVIVTLAVIAGAKLMKLKTDAAHGRTLWLVGHAPMIVVAIQFLLGWVALLAFLGDDTRKIAAPVAETLAAAPPIDPVRLLIRTSHQATGALLMATVFIMAVFVFARPLSRLLPPSGEPNRA
ncbi:MAG: COX15/CtaA family protein [Phycisphaerales bacterium]|jgi:cytochrome c oxidase assembly protein subunit 15|nr:COX15/CtaA family protein [Phycisphaerales bacterium]